MMVLLQLGNELQIQSLFHLGNRSWENSVNTKQFHNSTAAALWSCLMRFFSLTLSEMDPMLGIKDCKIRSCLQCVH